MPNEVMTLEEAIKILRSDIDDPGSIDIMDVNQAEELGIEALKFYQSVKAWMERFTTYLLPGETKGE